MPHYQLHLRHHVPWNASTSPIPPQPLHSDDWITGIARYSPLRRLSNIPDLSTHSDLYQLHGMEHSEVVFVLVGTFEWSPRCRGLMGQMVRDGYCDLQVSGKVGRAV
jgi:hypothetical protein